MNKEEVRVVLDSGGTIIYGSWTWSGCYFTCDCTDGEYTCCSDTFDSVEEAVEHLQLLCEGHWEDVYEYNGEN